MRSNEQSYAIAKIILKIAVLVGLRGYAAQTLFTLVLFFPRKVSSLNGLCFGKVIEKN